MSKSKSINIKSILLHNNVSNLNKSALFAVISNLLPFRKINDTTFLTIACLIDPSCDNGTNLKCNFFCNQANKVINKFADIGDVIKIESLKFQQYKGINRAVCRDETGWSIYKSETQIISNFKIRLSKSEKPSFVELKLWSEQYFQSLNKTFAKTSLMVDGKTIILNPDDLKTFSQLNQECFFDVLCQVCAIQSDENFMVLNVWDGTKTNLEYQIDRYSKVISENVLYIEDLELIFHVYIFDEHCERIRDLKPIDYVYIINAQSTKPNSIKCDGILKLPSRGEEFNRSIYRINPNDEQLNPCLKKKIENIRLASLRKRPILITCEEYEKKIKDCEMKIFSSEINNSSQIFEEPFIEIQSNLRELHQSLIPISKNYSAFTHRIENKEELLRKLEMNNLSENFSFKISGCITWSRDEDENYPNSIYVYCKNCDYINLLPNSFHNQNEFINIDMLSYDKFQNNSALSNDVCNNMNLNWLNNAQPCSVDMIDDIKSDATGFICEFFCPRCYILRKENVKLSYVYRIQVFLYPSEIKIANLACFLENDKILELSDNYDAKYYCCFRPKNFFFDLLQTLKSYNEFEIECLTMPTTGEKFFKIINFC